MNLTSLPFIGQLYLPFLLTSLIIGMLVLILLEKTKTNKNDAPQKTTLRENRTKNSSENSAKDSTSFSATQGPDEKCKTVPNTQTVKDEDCNTEPTPENTTKENVLQETTTSTTAAAATAHSSCSASSSASEEEVGRPRKVVKRPKKKHACKGSAISCATKRKVTAVTIVTDSQEEEVQVSLEDLAEEIRSQGVTCSVHPATTTHLPPLSSDPAHLLLLFGTTSEGCQRLQESLAAALGGGGAVPTPPPQPFLFSVTCWSASASGDVFESARDLNTSLSGCGGAEWLPIACIAAADETEADSEPPVMGRQQYIKTVMDKLTKPGKKCCGTSCGTKTIDIEDLASSLLLSRAAVTS